MKVSRSVIGLVAAVGGGGLLLALPRPAALPVAGHHLAALFVAVLILWVTEAFPVAVTALLALACQPLLGIAPLGAAFTGFISPVFFFVIAMFAIAQAFVSTGLDRRFALWQLAREELTVLAARIEDKRERR